MGWRGVGGAARWGRAEVKGRVGSVDAELELKLGLESEFGVAGGVDLPCWSC